MVCFPNAKINIGLNVISRREDGYHNIETIFYPIGLKDALEIVPLQNGVIIPEKGYHFHPSGIAIDGNSQDNLIIKALNLIKQRKKIPPINIHLLKKIPFGAGLGGGSSNAAFMLKLLNEMFQLDFTESQLSTFAATLGADCPFFIKNKPVFATGIGDQMEEIDLNLESMHFVLIKPETVVNTGWAYSMITPQNPKVSLRELIQMPMESWKETIKNDFEVPIFKKYPEICKIKEQLYDLGAVYAAMSGSGASVFGFFNERPQLDNIFENHFIWTNEEL